MHARPALLAIVFDFCVGVSSRPEQISCFCPSGRRLWLVISQWNWEEVAGSLYPLSMAFNLCLEPGSGRYSVPLPSADSFSFCSSLQQQAVCLGPGEERCPLLPTVAVNSSCQSRVRSQVRVHFLPLHRSSLLLFCFRKKTCGRFSPVPSSS